jgi:hypothetical protein
VLQLEITVRLRFDGDDPIIERLVEAIRSLADEAA